MTNTTGRSGHTARKTQVSKAEQAVAGVGREYLRVSVDRSGRARSTDEQHADNEREADRLGLVLAEPYRDDNRSASRYARKVREGFDRLIADLEADRLAAGTLILWESSRGSRKVSEWVQLIELCESRGVLIHVTTHGRTYDPANGRDRRSLLEDSVDSEHETWKISQRSKRAMAANAEAGKPHGRTPFGYRRVYDSVTRRFVAQEPDPAEAPVVRELFDRLRKGHSLRGIATDFGARGIRTRSGIAFTATHLRSIAVMRAYVGERVYDPGRKDGSREGQEARYIPAQWEGLVPRATFLAVQRILSDPARRTNRPGRGVHLLSMIARCGMCGGVLAARNRKDRAEYTCHKKSCVRVGKADLDKLAEDAILGYLSRDDVYEALAAQTGNADALTAVRDELADIQAELDELGDQLGRHEITATLAARAEQGILARQADALKREKALGTPLDLSDLLAPGKDVGKRWADAPMSTRRTAARNLFTPGALGFLCVVRSPRPGRPGPAAERIEWRTEDPATDAATAQGE